MALGLSEASINVMIGAGIALFSSAFLNWNQRRVNRDRFRRALIHEVSHIGTMMREFVDEARSRFSVEDVDEALIVLSTDILDADLAQMSKLTSREIRTVYEFYEATRLVKIELERQQTQDGHDPELLYQHARRVVALQDEVVASIKRSRLSRFTEWYKDLDWTLQS